MVLNGYLWNVSYIPQRVQVKTVLKPCMFTYWCVSDVFSQAAGDCPFPSHFIWVEFFIMFKLILHWTISSKEQENVKHHKSLVRVLISRPNSRGASLHCETSFIREDKECWQHLSNLPSSANWKSLPDHCFSVSSLTTSAFLWLCLRNPKPLLHFSVIHKSK